MKPRIEPRHTNRRRWSNPLPILPRCRTAWLTALLLLLLANLNARAQVLAPPQWSNLRLTTAQEVPVEFNLNPLDSNSPMLLPMQFLVLFQPEHGSLFMTRSNVNAGEGWSFIYTPDAGFIGSDRVICYAYNGLVSWATVTIAVSLLDTAAAVDDTTNTLQGAAVVVQALANDYNPVGQTIQLGRLTQPANGTVTDNGNGTVTYTPNPDFTGTDTFTYAIRVSSNSIYFPGTGHFYESVPAPAITWSNALSAAAARTVNGLHGYLATVTSAAENAFIFSIVPGVAWLGANDAAVEGEWRWISGPEAGQQFWQGLTPDLGGHSVSGAYANWGYPEPDNSQQMPEGEDYLELLPHVGGGQWNDLRGSGELRDSANNESPFKSLGWNRPGWRRQP